MAANESYLDLTSKENQTLLNPRLPEGDFKKLASLAKQAELKLNLAGHFWLATSGSTASSVSAVKLVALSKQALFNSAEAVNLHLQVSAKDIWTQVLPRFHVGGLGVEIRSFLSGSQVFSALNQGRWDATYFYNTVVSQKCTLSALVPTQVFDLVSQKLRAPVDLRAVVVGGGSLDKELYREARELGWPLLPSYGMTETASQVATAPLESFQKNDFPEMILLPHAEAKITTDGLVGIKATSLFTAYAQNIGEGAQIWDPKENGWFTTEDRGELQGNGIVIHGRGSDYVKIGGESTNLARLREHLEKCARSINPQWAEEVTLLEMPSPRLGHEIYMISTLRPEETEKILKNFSGMVLPFERPRQICYLQKIPRSDLGKILWGELRRLL